MAVIDVDSSYDLCARVTRREARNFYYAFASLPRAQRRAAYALYAFCREIDDVADACADDVSVPDTSSACQNSKAVLTVGTASGSGRAIDDTRDNYEILKADPEPSRLDASPAPDPRREGLLRLRRRLASAAEGEPTADRDVALVDTIDRFGVDPDDLAAVIDGVEMDLDRTRYASFDELREYCYRVASAVGLATLPILNAAVPPTDRMREHAVDLGLGMQLVNILRDVAEDLDRDRIYLPTDELARFGALEEDLRVRRVTDELRAFLGFQAARARDLLRSGGRLVGLLPRSGRACPWLLGELYGRILTRLEMSGFDVFAGRISLPAAEKLALLWTAPLRSGLPRR